MIREVLGLFGLQRMPKLGNFLLGKPRVCAWTFAEESLCMTDPLNNLSRNQKQTWVIQKDLWRALLPNGKDPCDRQETHKVLRNVISAETLSARPEGERGWSKRRLLEFYNSTSRERADRATRLQTCATIWEVKRIASMTETQVQKQRMIDMPQA